MSDGHDPAHDVRVELERAAAGLTPGDLLPGVHRRAGRIRRRRRVTGGVAAVLGVAAVVAAGATVPSLVSPDEPADVVAARPTTAGPTLPAAVPTPTGNPVRPAPADPPPEEPEPPTATAPASVWGATTVDEDFAGSALGRPWSAYSGPGDDLGSWAPANVAVEDGALRLSVTRPGGDPPSRWGGVGATGAAQRYGRWEARLRMGSARGVLGQFVLSPAPAGSGDPALVVSLAPHNNQISVSGTGPDAPLIAALPRPADYHTVTVEWTPTRVRVLLDGERLSEWTEKRPAAPLWPALQTILAGPDCGGAAPSTDCRGTSVTFPQRFDVDWFRVRAYRG